MAEIYDLNAHRVAGPAREASITRNQQILAEIRARWAARTPEEDPCGGDQRHGGGIAGSPAAICPADRSQRTSPLARQHRGQPGRAGIAGARAWDGGRSRAVDVMAS